MKPPLALTLALCALGAAIVGCTGAGNPPPAPQHGPPSADIRLRFLILDDLVSARVARTHGLSRTTDGELRALAQHCADRGDGGSLATLVADECALDDQPAALELPVFRLQPPALPELRGLTSTQIQEAATGLARARSDFEVGFVAFATEMRAKLDAWVKASLTAQMIVDSRFTRELADRHGRDYPRSDLVGAIDRLLGPNKAPRPGEVRYLVLRTDGMDEPGAKTPGAAPYRAKRTDALTEAELPGDVVLVFINTSGQPDASPLFANTTNAKLHCADFNAFLAWLSGTRVTTAK